MPILLAGFHHVGLLVTEIDRAAAFYEEVLGLEKLPRPDFGFPGRWYDMKNGQQLHLMSTADLPAHSTDNPAFDRHIAVVVSDIKHTAEQLTTLGIPYAEGGGRGGAQLFVRDPDGNMIEFRSA